MKTTGIIIFVLGLGVSFAIIGGSGVGAEIFGQDRTSQGLGPQEALNESAANANVSEGNEEGGISGEVAGDNEPSIVGMALSGGQFAVTLVAAIATLPVTLINLGFPRWFAVPLGMSMQVIGAVGLFQFVTGREWL